VNLTSDQRATVEVARALWREGALPSMIFRAVARRGHRGVIELMLIGREAFGLDLRDLKEGTLYVDRESLEPLPTFDAYFLPLIGRSAPR